MGEIVRACFFCYSCYIWSSHCHHFGLIYGGKNYIRYTKFCGLYRCHLCNRFHKNL